MGMAKKISLTAIALLVSGCGQLSSKGALLEANNGKFDKGDDRPACEVNEVEYLLDAKMVAFEMADHTLEEVGKQFDVTRERIRQIEAKAIRKLKHPSRSDKLRTYLDNL